MKHEYTIYLTVALLGLLGGCKKADQPSATQAGSKSKAVLLKVNWPVGNRYVYRMDLDQHSTNQIPQLPKPLQQDVTMAMTYAISALKETPQGGRELEMEFLANEIEAKMGGQLLLTFDSKENPQNDAKNPMAGPFRKMIGSKLRLALGADGKVEDVVGLDEWLKNVAGDGGDPAGQMLASQFNQGFFRQLADFGRAFSGKPVSVGETWPSKTDVPTGNAGRITVDAKVTLKGWEEREQHHCVVLDSKGVLTGTPGGEAGPMGRMTVDQGKFTGRSWFDPELGAMIDSTSDQAIRVKGQMPGPPAAGGRPAGGGFTSDIGQKITVKLVELSKTNG